MKTCTRCRRELEEADFAWKNKAAGVLASECKPCHRSIRNDHYKRHSTSCKAAIRERRSEIAEWIRAQKASRFCVKCGESHPATLDFHHVDGSQKDGEISRATRLGWGKDRILAEIAKCDVLCSNCHRKEHWQG